VLAAVGLGLIGLAAIVALLAFQPTSQAGLAEQPPAAPEVRAARETASQEQRAPVASGQPPNSARAQLPVRPEPTAEPTAPKPPPSRALPATKKPAAGTKKHAPADPPTHPTSSSPKHDAWSTDAFGGRG
jgi:hypothetical protein